MAPLGTSLDSADVRFDDATVSRRHALVVSQTEGVRVLDDRSLNGIYVNGARDLVLRDLRVTRWRQASANGIFGTGNNAGVLDPVGIASCGIRPDLRAEQVSVDGFLKLAGAL